MSQASLIEDKTQEPTSPDENGTETTGPLVLQELIIDVRKTNFTVTVEAGSMPHIGVNLVRHAKNDGHLDVDRLIDETIESAEKLGIQAARYRIVREDLPKQIPLQYRTASRAA